MAWSRIFIVTTFSMVLFITNVLADDTFVQIQEMVNDLGGQGMIKKNNGKVLKCANGGTKKITIKGGSYQAAYKNCREYGSTRDGEKFISIGGGDDYTPEKKAKYSKEPSYDNSWDITRSENNSLAVMTSGSIELTFNDKTEVLKEVKGLPDLKSFIAEGYKKLNRKFGTSYKASGNDETINIIKYIPQFFDFDRNAWDFCKEDQDIPKQKRNCNMTTYADAASVIVLRYNDGSLQPLIETYLFASKYNGKLIKKGNDFLELLKWCSYGECNHASDVFVEGNGPNTASIIQAFDYFNYIEWAASTPKLSRNPLIDEENKTAVEGADDPTMYKAAVDYLLKHHSAAKSLISKVKQNKDVLALYRDNKDAAKVKWIATKLQNELKITEDLALDMAIHSVDSIGKNWWGNKFTHVTRSVTYSLFDTEKGTNGESVKTYKGFFMSNKRGILRNEVSAWVQELQAMVRISEAEKVMSQNSTDRQFWVNLGNDYFDTNQPQKAIVAYQKAIDIAPDPSVLSDQGVMYRQIGQYEKAIAVFEQALKTDDKHLSSLYNIGLLYLTNMKQVPTAKEYWARYLAVDSTSETAIKIKRELEQK